MLCGGFANFKGYFFVNADFFSIFVHSMDDAQTLLTVVRVVLKMCKIVWNCLKRTATAASPLPSTSSFFLLLRNIKGGHIELEEEAF